MEFVGQNNTSKDCMIVALHNARLAAGIKSTYDFVYKMALKNKWYVPGKGFLIKHLDEAFEKLSLRAKLVEFNHKKIFYSIFNKNKTYIFFRPSTVQDFPGHAMVAAKCETGVMIYNPYIEGTGWRTIHKNIRQGEKHFTIQVEKIKER